MTKRIQFPESLYVIFYAYETRSGHYSDPELDASTVNLTCDAATFVEVEDFAMQYPPKDWEVVSIEKTYAYAEMFGGKNGERIDLTLRKDGEVEFNFGGTEVEKKFLARIVSLRERAIAKR